MLIERKETIIIRITRTPLCILDSRLENVSKVPALKITTFRAEPQRFSRFMRDVNNTNRPEEPDDCDMLRVLRTGRDISTSYIGNLISWEFGASRLDTLMA